MKERLIVVNEEDIPIGVASREEAWEQGLILRHAYVILRDSEGYFLLQKRSRMKKKFPGRLTWAATGHVDEGETYETAAHRELFEEIGIQTNLTHIQTLQGATRNKFGKPDTFISVFEGVVDRSSSLTLDPEEVESIGWFSYDEIKSTTATQPDLLTPNMRYIFRQLYASH
jgi:isopentenyldiphosphate isomerase